MDRTAYPFNGAAPKKSRTTGKESKTFSPSTFPSAKEPLGGLALTLKDEKIAKEWDASTVWFDDVLTGQWARDPDREAAVAAAQAAQEAEEELRRNTFPRAITGHELEAAKAAAAAQVGVSGRGKAAQMRRQYRVINGARSLSKVPPELAPERPEMLGPRGGPAPREWVLVAKDELAELQSLEAVLREEKTLMGAQAALTLDRVGLSAAEPLPMAKLAVEDVCHRTMQVARKECERLVGLQRKARAARASKTLGYERPDNNHHHHSSGSSSGATSADQGPMTTTIGYNGHRKRQHPGGPLASLTGVQGGAGTKRGGVGAMAARFVEQRRHLEAKREREECEDMWYEETIQRSADRYCEAVERKLDYQWYYVLACRYGPMTPAIFASSSRPGTLYLNRAAKGARGIQRLWRVWYAITMARRHRAARLYQTVVRKYQARVQWYPLIKFRCKYGRRRILTDSFAGYKANVARRKRLKRLLFIATMGWSDKCLKHWVTFTKLAKQEKAEHANKILMRIKHREIYVCWEAWHKYAKRCGDVKRMMKRALNAPCFHTWVLMTQYWKEQKQISLLAVDLQRLWRGELGRRRAATALWLMEQLKWMSRGKRARIDVGRALAVRKQEQVAKSLAALLEKRAASLVGRDLRLRAELTDTATAASSALESGVNKWLRRGAGKRELAEHARKVLGNEDGPIDPRELNLAKQQVKEERIIAAKQKARDIATHNVLAAAAASALDAQKAADIEAGIAGKVLPTEALPLWVCPNPECGATFPTEEHYLKHGLPMWSPPEGAKGLLPGESEEGWAARLGEMPSKEAKEAKKQRKEYDKYAKKRDRAARTLDPCPGCPDDARDVLHLHRVLLFGQTPVGDDDDDSDDDDDDESDDEDDDEKRQARKAKADAKKANSSSPAKKLMSSGIFSKMTGQGNNKGAQQDAATSKAQENKAKNVPRAGEPMVRGADRLRRFVEREKGMQGGGLFLLELAEALQAVRVTPQSSPSYEEQLAAICDKFLDPDTAAMKIEKHHVPKWAVRACLDEADTIRPHTEAGKKHLALRKRGFFGRLLGGFRKHGDAWGDGQRDPRPFLELHWQVLISLRHELWNMGFWKSDLAEAWQADATRQNHAREERLTEFLMAERRDKMLKEAAKDKEIAVAREQHRAELYTHLLEESLKTVYQELEQEFFDDELWIGVHEVADVWEAQAEEAVNDNALELTVEQTVKALEKQVADEILTEEWADMAVDLVVNEVVEFYFHSEMGSKVGVEAALMHGLVLDAATRPPKAPGRKNLLLSLGRQEDGQEGGVDEAVEAACSKIQGMWRARKARKMLRKLLVSVWCKRWDQENYCYYYENNLNGEVVWEAPRAFKMFFPTADW